MVLFMLSHKNINDNSIGLASNQLGLKGRIIIVKMKNRWINFINPTISYKSKDTIITKESCLSVPNQSIMVERSKEISIYCEINNKGWETNLNPYMSIVVQHEIDHLNGILITDYKKEINK